MKNYMKILIAFALVFYTCTTGIMAGEDLFGRLKLAEPLPQGAWELYQVVTSRSDKTKGTYQAYDYATEVEYGLTDRFTVSAALLGQSIKTSGLLIDGYIPGDKEYGLKLSGVEMKVAYNFLSPARHNWGLTGFFGLENKWVDPHSGFKKDVLSASTGVNLQKYLLEGQMVWANSLSLESTKATRAEIAGLPDGFEWPTFAEVELEVTARTGVSYRFRPKWFIGAELELQREYETEVDLERESLFGGPSIHYGGKDFWVTLSWLEQLAGSGETFDGQEDGYHLIEKTKREIRAKVGFNF